MSVEQTQQGSVEVFAGAVWVATMIKEMLADNGIDAFITNEYGAAASPYDFGALRPIKVIVSSADYDKAVQYIKEFNENYSDEGNG